jgi:hypothetical protein
VTKAHADAAHDLKALIQSRHPIITIDTVEEERVDNLLGIVASDLHIPLFTWTVTHGLQRSGGEHAVYGTANPQMLVRHLVTLTVRGICPMRRHAKKSFVSTWRYAARIRRHSTSAHWLPPVTVSPAPKSNRRLRPVCIARCTINNP